MPRRQYAGFVLEGLAHGTTLYRPHRRKVLIVGPESIYDHLRVLMGGLDREVFLCITLNARNHIKTVHIISVGSLSASIVHPREVFKHAIREGAAALILAHNHPSGQTDPSDDDLALTRRLVQVGELCGIQVMDHVIVGKEGFYSLKQGGYI